MAITKERMSKWGGPRSRSCCPPCDKLTAAMGGYSPWLVVKAKELRPGDTVRSWGRAPHTTGVVRSRRPDDRTVEIEWVDDGGEACPPVIRFKAMVHVFMREDYSVDDRVCVQLGKSAYHPALNLPPGVDPE